MQKLSITALISVLFFATLGGSLLALDNGRTFITPQTNLMWVADANHFVSAGLSSRATLPLAEAQRLVWAMNAGEADNFGRRNWRLASSDELAKLYQDYTSGKIKFPIQNFGAFEAWIQAARQSGPRTGGWYRLPTRGDDRLFAWPVRAATSAAQFEGLAVFGTNSVFLNRASHVVGDVAAQAASPGPVLDPGFELSVGRDASIVGDAKGDSVWLNRNVSVSGDVYVNELQQEQGSTIGGQILPFEPLEAPPFQNATIGAGAPDIFVDANEVVELPLPTQPGEREIREYGDITIARFGTLVFNGGIFNVRSITDASSTGGQCPLPCRTVAFSAPTDLRVEGRFIVAKEARVGPTAGSGLTARDVIIYVAGLNGGDGTPNALPSAAWVGQSSSLDANIYAANGTLRIDKNTIGSGEMGAAATGAFLGRDVLVDNSTRIVVDSFFRNQAPTADPVSVETNGADSVIINLSGSDPEGGDLTFSIESGPMNGTLGPIMEIVPDPIPDPDNPPELIQPPITQATVEYTPNMPAANLEDSFVYKVTDCEGAMGTATVSINPDDPSPPPPPAVAVTATDTLVDVALNISAPIGLDAGAPPDFSLTFFVNSLPASGSLTDSAGNSIETVPYDLPSPLVNYTSAVTGLDGFDFGARDSATTQPPCSSPSCDIATVTVDVQPRPPLAVDQEVMTDFNQPLLVTLFANPGGTGVPVGLQPGDFRLSRLSPIGGLHFALPGADVAGTVADEDLDGNGDTTDPLPGSAPVFVSAGVDVNPHDGPASFDSEAALLGSVGNSVTYDFETASGFPSSGNNIGLFQGIDFDAQTVTFGSATSGTQGMTGTSGTFSTAVIDFTGLEAKPIAIGFFALDLTQIGNEVIRVTIDYTNAPDETFDVGLGGQPTQTPIYFGRVSGPFDSIESITLFGTDDGEGPRAWLIDDLSLGFTGSTSSARTWTLNGVAFDDGQSASGYFVFDATTQSATDWNITTTAGTTPFDQFTYTPANSTFSKFDFGNPTDTLQFSSIQQFLSPPRSRQFRITPDTELTNQGGSVDLDLATSGGGSGGTECFNCSPFRVINAGSVSAPNFNGLEGIHRVQIEWDVSGLDIVSSDEIESAIVTLSTNRGSVDSLDTFFFSGDNDQNGALSPSDYEAAVTAVPNVVMPVPAGSQPGDDGTFSFNVTNLVKAAWDAGFNYFSIQGRVDEDFAGTGFKRGLQIRSTATGNLSQGLEPKLDVLTAPPPSGVLWTVTVVPEFGTLKTLGGMTVVQGTTFTSEPTLVYTPSLNYTGPDSITYEVAENGLVDSALIMITVTTNDPCILVGRPPGCSP